MGNKAVFLIEKYRYENIANLYSKIKVDTSNVIFLIGNYERQMKGIERQMKGISVSCER